MCSSVSGSVRCSVHVYMCFHFTFLQKKEHKSTSTQYNVLIVIFRSPGTSSTWLTHTQTHTHATSLCGRNCSAFSKAFHSVLRCVVNVRYHPVSPVRACVRCTHKLHTKSRISIYVDRASSSPGHQGEVKTLPTG